MGKQPKWIPPPSLDLVAINGRLRLEGEPFFLKGVSWAGSEGIFGVPFGLNARPLIDLLTFLRQNKFNAVRLTFSHRAILSDLWVNKQAFDKALNPEFIGISYFEMLRLVIKRAGEAGLLVLLGAVNDGLWLSDKELMMGWTKLSRMLCIVVE